MSDPRVDGKYGPQAKSANLSPLMLAKSKASQGETANFCPHGCETSELDENGHCYHLVGFCKGEWVGDKLVAAKLMEPTAFDVKRGRWVVKCKMRRNAQGQQVPVLEPVLSTDKLERITDSFRVYRNVPKPEPVDEFADEELSAEDAAAANELEAELATL
jgi:hypothetical protein